MRTVHREVIEGVFGLDADAVRDGAIEYPKSALRTAREALAAGAGDGAEALRAFVARYGGETAPD